MVDGIEIIEVTKDLVPKLVSIEQAAFPDPWTDGMISGSIGKDRVFAIVRKKEFLGYTIFSMVLESSELLRIAVIPKEQNKGLGSVLLSKLLEDCKFNKIEKVFLEVRQSNMAAIELYKKFGFEIIGRRKHYYRSPSDFEDALTMSKTIEENVRQKKI